MKLIWYYNNQIGRPGKKKIIGRMRGYHGNTVATASLSGQPHMQADFDLPLGDRFLHISNPNYYRVAEEGETEDAVQRPHGGRAGGADRARGRRHHRRLLRRAGAGRRRRHHPAGGYFEVIQPILKPPRHPVRGR